MEPGPLGWRHASIALPKSPCISCAPSNQPSPHAHHEIPHKLLLCLALSRHSSAPRNTPDGPESPPQPRTRRHFSRSLIKSPLGHNPSYRSAVQKPSPASSRQAPQERPRSSSMLLHLKIRNTERTIPPSLSGGRRIRMPSTTPPSRTPPISNSVTSCLVSSAPIRSRPWFKFPKHLLT